jgi:hypothetical protein
MNDMASFLEISNCHKNRFGKVSPCMCIESVILIIYPQSVLLCLMSDDFSENLFPLTKKPLYKYIFENSFQVNSFLDQFYIYNYAQHLIDCNFLIIYILSHRKKKKKKPSQFYTNQKFVGITMQSICTCRYTMP